MQRLPDDSLTVALMRGGRQYFGWNRTTFMLADLFDAVNTNTQGTGNWKPGKVPRFPAYPRPESKPKNTVKDIYRMLQGG